MGVSIEALVFTVRMGEEHNAYGDPYTDVCTVTKIDEGVARVTALGREISKSDAHELRKLLHSLGFTEIVWERKKGTTVRKTSSRRDI